MKIAMLIPDNREESKNYTPPDPTFGTAPTALLQGFERLPQCDVHIISCTQQPLRAPAKLADNIYYHSLLVPRWGWLRGGYVLCVRAIRKKLRELKPDIVHGHGTERYCALSAALSGFPNVITIHGNMRRVAKLNHSPPFSFNWLAARLERFTLPRVGGVICLSTHTRHNVEPLNKRTWLVPNAIDDSFFSVAPNPAQPPEIICVADIIKLKNQLKLIEALDPLSKTHAFRLRFFGKTNEQAAYVSEFFKVIQQRPWCEYGGFADRPTLRSILAKAAILVLPTLEDNCPMAVIEAMAAGVPVAAARIGGIPDLITDGVDGLLFDPQNSDQISSAISKMLNNTEFRTALARSARLKADQHFRPVAVARQHLAIYAEQLQDDGQNPK